MEARKGSQRPLKEFIPGSFSKHQTKDSFDFLKETSRAYVIERKCERAEREREGNQIYMEPNAQYGAR